MIKNKSGVWGEVYAARYLRDKKYKILTVNYSCRFGEADIIAQQGGTVCFVEVKTRDESTKTPPAEAVDEAQQRRLTLTAENFLSYLGEEKPSRFDVCEVYLDKNMKAVKINYIEIAFQPAI